MIIAKELIDASIDSKNLAQQNYEKKMLDAVKSKIPEVEKLSSDIADIIETYRYVRSKDEKIGNKMWSLICKEGDDLKIDFCNAITDSPATKLGVRPHYSAGKQYYGDLYVTCGGVLFGDLKDLKQLTEANVKDWLRPQSYATMFNSMELLIEAIPAYKERIANKLNELLK